MRTMRANATFASTTRSSARVGDGRRERAAVTPTTRKAKRTSGWERPARAMTRGGRERGAVCVAAAVNETFVQVPATEEEDDAVVRAVQDDGEGLSFVVFGASGDLAKKKIYPALFALYYEGRLPKTFKIYGYARSSMTTEEFRDKIAESLTCRIDWSKAGEQDCAAKSEEFFARCEYVSGQYDQAEDFRALDELMTKEERGMKKVKRVFYLSIPPSIFVPVAQNAARECQSKTGDTRVIVEKPFGRDLKSSRELTAALANDLSEEQTYRIDHYLGKELIENLTVLRFSNIMFQPLWNRNYIRNVQINFSENFGTEGRGGYFDNYGIIRDIMQNHLLQILALFAMEEPASLDAEDIRNEKVKVIRSMRPIEMDNVALGQYKGRETDGKTFPAYLDDSTVPKGSLCPTFAAMALFIDNARWDGVPFLLKAGKALHKRQAEIRVQFRHAPGNLYGERQGRVEHVTNELVIRIQPDEAIYLRINNKVPGLGQRLDQTILDLQYKNAYGATELPDAYERLILDVINGDKRLFIRNDELEAAWKLFTPLLDKIEGQKIAPELYPYGSRGPIGAHYLASRFNVRWGDTE